MRIVESPTEPEKESVDAPVITPEETPAVDEAATTPADDVKDDWAASDDDVKDDWDAESSEDEAKDEAPGEDEAKTEIPGGYEVKDEALGGDGAKDK